MYYKFVISEKIFRKNYTVMIKNSKNAAKMT